eukprot:Skav222726  [mRNA]  locus=scaffold2390:169558:175288:+ [translate_table: standard]
MLCEVERLDHRSAALLPLFFSISLRKQLPNSEREFGPARHALIGHVSRKELDKALSLAYLESWERNESLMIVFPPDSENSTYGGIEHFTEMVEAEKWEIRFAATAASQEELGFVVLPDGDNSCLLMWRLGQVKRFLDASAFVLSSPAFCLRGKALYLQLRWPSKPQSVLGIEQLSGKLGESEWREAQGEALVHWEGYREVLHREKLVFSFGPFDALEKSLDPVSDSLLVMVRILVIFSCAVDEVV